MNLNDPSGLESGSLAEKIAVFATIIGVFAIFQGFVGATTVMLARDAVRWDGPTLFASVGLGDLTGGIVEAGVQFGGSKLESEARNGRYTEATHLIFGPNLGFNLFNFNKAAQQFGSEARIGYRQLVKANPLAFALGAQLGLGMLPFEVSLGDTTIFSPTMLFVHQFEGKDPGVLDGAFLEASVGISGGLFAALASNVLQRLGGRSIPPSFGAAATFQGYGVGGSWPNNPYGIQPQLGGSVFAGISADFTDPMKIDQPDTRSPK